MVSRVLNRCRRGILLVLSAVCCLNSLGGMEEWDHEGWPL